MTPAARPRIARARAAAILAAALACVAAEEVHRPDLVHVALGWVGFGDLGCYGGLVPTPHIDALAADGVRFTRCTTALTDYYAELEHFSGHSAWTWSFAGHPQARRTIPVAAPQRLLADAGYHAIVELGGLWPNGRSAFARLVGAGVGGGAVMPEAIAAKVRAWDGARPLYLCWSPTTFHAQPVVRRDIYDELGDRFAGPAAELAGRVRARQVELGIHAGITGWTNPIAAAIAREERPRAGPTIRFRRLGADAIEESPATSPADLMRAYAAGLVEIDRTLGEIVGELKRRGRYAGACFVVTADAGAAGHHGRHGSVLSQVSSTPFIGETRRPYAGGRTVPLILVWPTRTVAAARGAIVDGLVTALDPVPTLLAAAGVAYPGHDRDGAPMQPLPGISLLPVLAGAPPDEDRTYATATREGLAFVATRRWSAWGPWPRDQAAPAGWKLFDAAADPCERTDVAARHGEVLADLRARWAAWEERWCVLHPWDWGELGKRWQVRRRAVDRAPAQPPEP